MALVVSNTDQTNHMIYSQCDNYIVITPVKNEMQNLPALLKSILSQTIRTKLWLIVDDGSTDGSYELLLSMAGNYPWIEIVRLGSTKRREVGFHYAKVTKIGLDKAMYLCKKKNIPCDYIALLDADMVIERNYYESLIKKFKENRRLGIASGIVISILKNRKIWEKEPPEWPCGAARLWSRKCYEETGWMVTRAPDSVSTIKAIICGYKTRSFYDIIALQSRLTCSGSGFWKGYLDLGKTRYYLGYSPFFAVFASFKYFFLYPYFGAIPFVIGYFNDFINYQKRINDKQVINFFKKRFLTKLMDKIRNIPFFPWSITDNECNLCS